MDVRLAWACAALLACSATPPAPAQPDQPDAAAPFVEATHALPLAIPSGGGATLASARIAVVTFAGYSYADSIEAMADFVPTSQWLGAVSAEYGAGTPSVVAKVRLPDAAPAFASAASFSAWVASRTLPPADFYAFVFPPGATFGDPNIGVLCNDFTGYHDAQGTSYTFAVIGTCPKHVAGLSDAEQAERVFSHELVEAITNPFGNGFAARDPELPFSYVGGGELADVCDGVAREGGFVFSRSWSNAAAASGADPCQPAPSTYFNVSPSSLGVRDVAAGSSVTIALTGFSTSETTDWVLENVAGSHAFNPQVGLDVTEMNNGRSATLAISVPASATPGSTAVLFLRSFHAGDSAYALQPLVVRAQ